MKTTIPFRHRAIPFVLQNIAWFFPTWPLLTLLLHIKFKGKENIAIAFKQAQERGVGVLFCSNHLSELDPILILFGTGPFSRAFPMFFVIYAVSVYRNVALFGWRAFLYGEFFFKCWGAHPLMAGKKDYAVALAPHVPILESGYPLMVFPEGTLSKTGELLPARGGVGYLALKTGAVILPIKIAGIAGMSMADFWLGRRSCTVAYGTPLTTETLVAELAVRADDPAACKLVATKLLESIGLITTT